MKKILLLCLVAASIMAKAQYVSNYKKIADTYFANGDYYAASEYYKKGLGIGSDTAKMVFPYSINPNLKKTKEQISNEEMVYKLAESSRLYKNFTLAQKYYGLAKNFTGTEYSDASYYYALCVKTTGKYEEAIPAFQEYLTKYPSGKFNTEARKQIQLCQMALGEITFPKIVQISKVTNSYVNTLGSNYSPVINNGKLYFTSSRPTTSFGKSKVIGKSSQGAIVKKPSEFVNALYVVNGDLSATTTNVSALGITKEKGREYAAPAFSMDGKRVYFTSWLSNDTAKHYQIFSADLTNDKWTVPTLVNDQVNSAESNSMQAFVTSDSRYIIFSSDRTGGLGKYDLWYCPLRPDGSMGQAVNMGPGINSTGNDRAPYYNTKSEKLIYSSDGKDGFGGYDFYTANGGVNSLSKAENMGYPFNSAKDDIYFTSSNEDASEGYFSSDRESLCCLEIFKFKQEDMSISGKIVDCKTKKPLMDVKVTLTERGNTKTSTTDANGIYNLKVETKRPVKLTFALADYFGITKEYSSQQLIKADTLLYEEGCMTSFRKNEPIVLNNIYFAFNSAELNEDSKNSLNTLVKILKDNAGLSIELSAHTDSKGSDAYNLDLSQKRAQSCVDYLIQNGIAAEKLIAKGYGESRPVAPNTLPNGKDNPDGRAKNRRTEFTVLGQDL